MDKTIALFIVAVGLVYSNLESSHWFFGYLLPAASLLGLAYLLWLKPFLALCGAYFSFQSMDLNSQSWFNGVLLPLFFALCVFYLIGWLTTAAVLENTGGTFGGDAGGGDWGDGGGGDGGGD